MVNSLTFATKKQDYHTEFKVLLLRLGITQRELARQLDVCPEYLNRVLRGKRAGLALRRRMVRELGFPAWLEEESNERAA